MKRFRKSRILAAGAVGILLMAFVALARDRPLAVSPGSGAGTVIAGACPTFSWGAVTSADGYDLVAYRVPAGASASPEALKELWRVHLPGTVTTWTPPLGRCFAYGESYAWAVRAEVGARAGDWSEPNLFAVAKAPSAEEVRGLIARLRSYLGTTEGEAREPAPGSEGGRADSRAASRQVVPHPAGHAGPAALAADGSGSRLGAKVSAATPTLGTPSLTLDGNLSLGAASNLFKGGSALLWNDTAGNLALGHQALASNVYGYKNTVVGSQALYSNVGGTSYEGSVNAVFGDQSLFNNTTGYFNVAMGHQALYSNTTGARNVAIGLNAEHYGSAGNYDTAVGYRAMFDNGSGTHNTAVGALAMEGLLGSPGSDNTALGDHALALKTGSGNIAIGARAGNFGSVGASDDILIGNDIEVPGSNTIQIGTPNQTKTYIAGIRGATTSLNDAVGVVIDGNGQLGTVSSSRRLKQDIRDMGDATDKLYALRPVTFRYRQYVEDAVREGKDPGELPRSYGLIAEDVAEVFPDLVVYGKDGKPETIKYRLLAPMLLNELQKEHRRAEAQERELRFQAAELERQKLEVARLERQRAAESAELARLDRLVRVSTAKAATTGAARGTPTTRLGSS